MTGPEGELEDIKRPHISKDIYDPRPRREGVRTSLATIFSIHLVILTLGPLVAIVAGFTTWAEIEGLMIMVYSSVVGVVGTVIGFYFGSQAKER